MRAEKPTTNTTGGKRQFLVHIDADLIRQIKILALDRNVSASSLVQEALHGYLATSAGSCPPRGKPGEKP